MIDKTLGHYKIISQLGGGGMGEVYLAEDLSLDRKVALKFLPEVFTGDPERMARFEREAKLLASLNHPNIAAIYGLEQADGKRFLIMEYVEGETLQARISKGALPLEEALGVCRQIAEGLEAAHEKGVIHRDLKPANVMITGEEKVKILDFGLAKALLNEGPSVDSSQSPTITEAMTQPGVILGTAAYMSPEQAKGKSVDKRSDIWAFGCILYECLTGKKAFEGESVTETLAAVIKEEPDWNKFSIETPQNIRFVLHRCLEKEKGRRFQSAADVRILIDETPYTVEVTKSEKHHLPWIAWSIAAAFILAFAILFFIHVSAKSLSQFKPVQIQMGIPPNRLDLPFSLSPNGKYLAFPALMGAGMYLEIRPLNSIETNLLLNTESVSFMSHFWSPDGRFIVFDGGGKLKKIDVSEGQSKFVCDLEGYANGGSWNQNDLIIFGDTGAKGLMQVPSSGGTALPLTRTNPERMEIRHSSPVFLPDGNHFLYVCESDSNEYSGIYVGTIDSDPGNHKSTQLVVAATTPCYVPSQDSDLGQLFFLQDLALKTQLFNESRLNLVGEPLTIAEDISHFSISANGVLIYGPSGI